MKYRPRYKYIIYVSFWKRIRVRADTHEIANGTIILSRISIAGGGITHEIARFSDGIGFVRKGK